jgi:hypothetical protein
MAAGKKVGITRKEGARGEKDSRFMQFDFLFFGLHMVAQAPQATRWRLQFRYHMPRKARNTPETGKRRYS